MTTVEFVVAIAQLALAALLYYGARANHRNVVAQVRMSEQIRAAAAEMTKLSTELRSFIVRPLMFGATASSSARENVGEISYSDIEERQNGG